MSMTTEERKAWAVERLSTYLREVEAGEMWAEVWELVESNSLAEEVESVKSDLANVELGLTNTQKDVDSLADRLDEVEEALPA